MKLERIPVPVWSPPGEGPWRIRGRWPSGETFLGASRFDDRAEAEEWAAIARKICRQGCTYDVVPDPGRDT